MEATVLTERGRRNLAILDTIRRAGAISRAEISRSLRLNVVTISNYIDEFLRQNIVLERDLDVSGGGRRPVLLGINPDVGLAVGVGLNLLNTVATTVNIKGEMVGRVKTENNNNVRDIVDSILDLIQRSIDNIEQKDKIKGIGVGIAGVIDKEKDIVRWPQKIGDGCHYATISLPLKSIIEKRFGLPCLIENDATLACFGEQWLSLGPEAKNVLFLFSGVGCGIIINGEIYRGATGCAGEISISSRYEAEGDFSCQVGNPCFVKRWEADLGIVSQARQNLKDGMPSIMSQKSDSLDILTLNDVFDAARKNDNLAMELLKSAGRRLGIKAAYLVNIFNPRVLIVGGGIEEDSGILVDAVRQGVADWAFEEMVRAVKIIPSTLGENAVALGAANLVIRQMFTEA
ncbi:MAG: ROK family protein [Candidatus Omnitrophota bacterium]